MKSCLESEYMNRPSIIYMHGITLRTSSHTQVDRKPVTERRWLGITSLYPTIHPFAWLLPPSLADISYLLTE